jgi:hypothetical protein
MLISDLKNMPADYEIVLRATPEAPPVPLVVQAEDVDHENRLVVLTPGR